MSMKNRSDCIIGKRIREQRKKKGMSQVDLSHMLRVNDSTISKYENGDASVSLDKLIMIADIFDVSVDYLLGRSESAAIENYAIGHELGLTDKAIKTLRKITANSSGSRNYIALFNALISSSEAYDSIRHLFERIMNEYRHSKDIKSGQLASMILEDVDDLKIHVQPEISIIMEQCIQIQNDEIYDILHAQTKEEESDISEIYRLVFGNKDTTDMYLQMDGAAHFNFPSYSKNKKRSAQRQNNS